MRRVRARHTGQSSLLFRSKNYELASNTATSSTRRKKTQQDDVAPSSQGSPASQSACAIAAPISPWSDAGKIFSSVIAEPSFRQTVLYAGQSGYGSILEALGQEPDAQRHITIQGALPKALLAEDLHFLQAKGCFELPARSDALFEAFFNFVHPLFPVLDGPSLVQQYEAEGLKRMNLLLIWSMFAVSASYLPEYSSKETKALFMKRGRALFDLSGEKDRIVLLQSALLLSFWFDDPEDVKQSWYWSGIAFSVAHTLGLHIPLATHSLREDEGPTGRSLWRSIWHCCLVRDAWLSFTMGRPLRLLGVAHDADLLLATECKFANIRLAGKRVYSEADTERLETMWRRAVTLADALRQALLTSDRSFERMEKLQVAMSQREESDSSLVLLLATRHMRLCHSSAVLGICQLSGDWARADAATDVIVDVVESYFADSSTGFVPLSIVPLIVPAMVVALSGIKSAEPRRVASGETRVRCCLRLLTAVEHSYPAASIVKRLFTAALTADS